MSLTAALERQTGRLPAELTSFIGRKAELEQVRRLVDGHRLVTLTGPGGVGKSRLAVRIADLARDAFDDGVVFVGLSGLTEPSLLAQTICDAVGVADRGGESATACLADHLADLRLLLVLDTCEHLVDGCAMLAEALLRAAPGLRVLATSRQPLDVVGEYTFPVAPLDRPGSGRPDGEECDSVRLFAERAAATVQGWTLTGDDRDVVIRLCDRLDGIPLAIELAAVQLRTFSLDQMLGRLGTRLFQVRGRRTGLQRHQTLRATVDWSHELCSADERLLWARLSVFATDFDLDAAEQVCSGGGLAAEQIVEVLTGLLEKSIVQRADRGGRVRYRMLDTLREYGAERLAALGAGEEIRLPERCFDWYAGLLRRARLELSTAAQVRWLDWFGCERANIRALLGRVLPVADEETIREAMGALGRFWALNGILGESRHWMDRLLESRDTTGPGWSDFLTIAALTMTLQNNLDVSGELLERALAQARAEDDQDGVAAALAGQGVAALFAGDFDRSLQLLGTAGELYGETGYDDLFILLTEVFRGLAHLFKNDLPAAIAHAGQAVRTGEERGELWARSYGMLVCGLALWLAGDLDESMLRLREALRIKRDLDDGLGLTLGLEGVAGCLCSRGEFVRAAMLLGASDRMRETTQTAWFGPHHTVLRDIHIDQAVNALGQERYRAAFEEGQRLPPAHAIDDALGVAALDASASEPAGDAHPLTERELQVAALVAEGLSNRDIAERLTIAKRTADSHIEHILTKLGYSSRAQIAAWITAQDVPPP
ncbi:LuxR C-terminal-related transcriptional regulator [Actinomadura sp. BRA 177]|uniref:ATP-binding protein n=1 Tax=Actinomadura sp. BRA 177 TaxID=2745202 RepID=UPI001595A434|nr:LuxR C-terminal-related transcriptional regulator [Actinomadura sp. BRA 177]NVI91843.1 AAA family ATPase [Actinomadura sp. BRA 177]